MFYVLLAHPHCSPRVCIAPGPAFFAPQSHSNPYDVVSALHPLYLTWMGPCRGVDDLREGIIRTPLSPMITFRDDPLRVLRAVRFAARFGFSLHEVGVFGCMCLRADGSGIHSYVVLLQEEKYLGCRVAIRSVFLRLVFSLSRQVVKSFLLLK